jgi:hypothetical protein
VWPHHEVAGFQIFSVEAKQLLVLWFWFWFWRRDPEPYEIPINS